MNPTAHNLYAGSIFCKRLPAATIARLESMLPSASTWIICDTIANGYRYTIQASWRASKEEVAELRAKTYPIVQALDAI